MSLKRKQAEDGESPDDDVYRSVPLEDRASRFIGFFSPSLKPKELQELAEIESASHRVVAWRKESNQQSITKAKQYVTRSDDDGEKYGGKRIEKVLESLRVEGCCVVARWYGGVLLGPVRFEHIDTVAKEAIEAWRHLEAENRAKRQRIEEEKVEHTRLVSALCERDQSITVLRSLAFEKEVKVRQAKGSTEANNIGQPESPRVKAPPASPSAQPVVPDYASMAIEKLRGLDKARDATITFLLKRIDKAEAELKSLDNTEARTP